MSTTIACDIDGVIAPVTLTPDRKSTVELPQLMYGTHMLTRSIAALKTWIYRGADVQWHSTWRNPYTDELERLMTLPHLQHFATEEEFLQPGADHTWWKLTAIERWLTEHPEPEDCLVWIDDDIAEAIDAGQVDPGLLTDPRVLIISPQPAVGLTREQIQTVENHLAHALTA